MKTQIQVNLPDGRLENKTGELLDVQSQLEPWSIYSLSDGTTVRVKQSILQAVRIDGEYDAFGNPIYVLQTAPISVITAPENLKKPK